MPPFVPLLKKLTERLPEPVGFALAGIPYSWRGKLGWDYAQRRRELRQFAAADAEHRREFVLRKMRALVAYSYEQVPFYKWHYDRHGFSPFELVSFTDLARIPMVTKSLLNEWPLEKRSTVSAGRYLANTGGSSGQPFAFYITPALIPHEWAHMHTIWEKLGYRSSMLKVGFGGRNLNDQALAYDALRHQYAVNIYRPFAEVAQALQQVAERRPIRFLHGYPSAIHEFAQYCAAENPRLVELLRASLLGVFLGSEYPAPVYRDKIEAVFATKTISWYGHTERAVLAGELTKAFHYEPFQTYGFAEAVVDSGTGRTHLVGTAYHNMASPLIRYDTGDEIEGVVGDDGLLAGFKVTGGRLGEFVVDRTGKNIPLTGLIFGRHHPAFNCARFVQVFQPRSGAATLLITPGDAGGFDAAHLGRLFDLAGIDIEFSFQIIPEPVRTPSGKVPLRVTTLPGPEHQGDL